MVNIPGFSVHGVALARLYPEADSKMEPSRQEHRGSFPPVEELFDGFRNEDGVDSSVGGRDKFIEDVFDSSINAKLLFDCFTPLEIPVVATRNRAGH